MAALAGIVSSSRLAGSSERSIYDASYYIYSDGAISSSYFGLAGVTMLYYCGSFTAGVLGVCTASFDGVLTIDPFLSFTLEPLVFKGVLL